MDKIKTYAIFGRDGKGFGKLFIVKATRYFAATRKIRELGFIGWLNPDCWIIDKIIKVKEND